MSGWINANEDVISREWILKEFDKGKPILSQSEYFAELFWLVRHAPAVTPSLDLVRCGECKYWGNSYICWRRRAKPIAMNPDDFCSYGERKET